MRLSKIFNNSRMWARRTTHMVRNPFQFFWARGAWRVRQKLLNTELPGTDSREGKNRRQSKRSAPNKVKEKLENFGESFGRRFTGSEKESTAIAPRETSIELYRKPYDPRFETHRRIGPAPTSGAIVLPPLEPEIPDLKVNQEIRGRRGRYRCIGEALIANDKFRVYPGVHSSTNQLVLIKEYLLSETIYNQEERRFRKKQFASIVDVGFKNTDGQGFRVITPLETIAPSRERCCYLITELVEKTITIRQYVESHGALPPKQLVKFLDQALQTLWFLHTHQLRFASGRIQHGTPHGNLNLDNVLVDVKESTSDDDEAQLFVYLANLGLWEHIFTPPNLPIISTSSVQDLIDLGSISASLLLGKTETDDKNWFLASDNEEDNWLAKDEVLGGFVLRLLQINGKFESALTARQELLRLEREGTFDYQQELLPTTVEVEEAEPQNRQALWVAVGATALLSGLIGAALIINHQFSNAIVDKSIPCCIAKVKPTQGLHAYAAQSGIWNYVLERSGFMSKNSTFKQELEARQPLLENYSYQGAQKNAIAKLRGGELDFVLGHANNNLPDDLEQEIVAFHGLTVFVAYSDDYRKENIPNALRGKISLQDLRTFYTKGIDEWEQPRKLNDWDVRLYVPFEPEAIAMFRDLLFQDDEENAADKRKFMNLSQRLLARQRREMPSSPNYPATTRNVVENVFLDYERNKTISIGFGYFNSVFGQCAVYPLAVKDGWKSVQPYVTTEGKSITPKIDLCNDKGGYAPNTEAFNGQKYPLGYKLAVIYPKDEKRSVVGKQFAKLLKTEESQYLFEEAGIIPLNKP